MHAVSEDCNYGGYSDSQNGVSHF